MIICGSAFYISFRKLVFLKTNKQQFIIFALCLSEMSLELCQQAIQTETRVKKIELSKMFKKIARNKRQAKKGKTIGKV